jgi:murein DD-endopeptidase MepM/ murein hydrolase activator NlpD
MRLNWISPNRRALLLYTLPLTSVMGLCALLGIFACSGSNAPSADATSTPVAAAPVADAPVADERVADELPVAVEPDTTVALDTPASDAVDPQPAALSNAAAAAATPTPKQSAPRERVVAGTLGRGQTLASAMSEHDVDAHVVNLIAREMRGHYDFRRSHPGDGFRLKLDANGEVESFIYRITKLVHYELTRAANGDYAVARLETKLTPRQTMVAGVVTSSLYGAITGLGAGPQLANDFADVFAYDMDFSRMVQPGDEFRILYERLYRTLDDGAEIFVKPGRILAARYAGQSGEHTAVYFETDESHGGYYRPDGSAVERQFLMAPLRYSRISSRYSPARRHPILKVTRPHHGIDYAAPHGTPVYAVSGGEVVHRSWGGGFGNLVKVRHSNGYTSYYAHLSRFASGLRKGQQVSQKQVIGYVGSTGLATGPHVCFRVRKDGRYVNPARIPSPAGPPLPKAQLAPFKTYRDTLLAALDSGTLVASDEAL